MPIPEVSERTANCCREDNGQAGADSQMNQDSVGKTGMGEGP